MSQFTVREAIAGDRPMILNLLREHWGGESIVVRETVFRPADLPTFVAVDGGENLVGFIAYTIEPTGCEVMVLESLIEGRGVGSALLAQVERQASASGLESVSLMTTNDNIDALRFYLRRGYRITSVSLGAVDRARLMKPSITLVASNGIPIHDELTLVKELDGADGADSGETP